MNANQKRERLVAAAAELFHRQGIPSTSLADIAKHADIPIGNVYYYFKTKDELALAALERRQAELRVSYASLDETVSDPRARLVAAVKHFEGVRDDYAAYGCPIGKLIFDANGTKDAITRAASGVFEQFIAWAERQFAQLGHAENSRKYATMLLSGIEGGSVMAKALSNPQILSDEITRLVEWLESLPNRKIFLGKAGMVRAPESVD